MSGTVNRGASQTLNTRCNIKVGMAASAGRATQHATKRYHLIVHLIFIVAACQSFTGRGQPNHNVFFPLHEKYTVVPFFPSLAQ
uniref:Uncharacterized protein n=1 Tax=Anguilla anguilla TaxID=7936 RepID=A0A0E9WRX5_ANGAN